MCEVRIALLPFLHSEISERSRGLRIGGEDAPRSVKDGVGALSFRNFERKIGCMEAMVSDRFMAGMRWPN